MTGLFKKLLHIVVFVCCVVATQASSVIITEIMYHPPVGFAPGTTNIIDGDDYEFLELFNAGTNAIDLNGAAFIDGISYQFVLPTILNPGEFLVLVKELPRFTERYPWAVSSVNGEYGGKLSNGGETVTLVDASSNLLYSVTYNDSSSWPQLADGDGTALQIVDVNGDPDSPANWCDSDLLYGSPGAVGECAELDIVINEILAHTDPPLEDAIELLNMTTGTIDITGWRLSDSIHDVTKYSITNDNIAVGNFAVFYEYQFNDTNNILGTDDIPFAISSFGDEIYLVAPGPTTNQWRLIDRLDFPGTPNGYSFGHYPDGTGTVALLQARSFGVDTPATVEEFRTGIGVPNYPPRVGPVVINEIMYHSAYTNDGSLDYIELYNAGTSTVDISYWSISGVGFTNPPGTTIAAGAYLVYAENAAVLQSVYGITGVIGDWPGTLKNGGETLVLRDHDGAEIDRVKYDDKEPWPVAADGFGPSLERIDAFFTGDDPANWTSTQADTNWVTVSWTQIVTSASGRLKFWLDSASRCWLDDVSVVSSSGGTNLVGNGSFESGTNGWTAIGNHSTSRPEIGWGIAGSSAMCIAGTFDRYILGSPAIVYIYYGDATNNVVESESFPLISGQSYVVSFRTKRHGIGRKIYAEFSGVKKSVWFGLSGTPSAENSIPAGTIPFALIDVDHATNITSTATSIAVIAEVSDPSVINSIKVYYRQMPIGQYEYTDADYSTVIMTNISGSIFGCEIPGNTTNRVLVRYHVEAVLTNGLSVISPRSDDPSGDYGYWIESTLPQTNIPNWNIFSDSEEYVLHPTARRVCAVSPDGQVFNDVIFRHRGHVSSSPTNTGVALRFNQGQLYDSWFMKNQDGVNFRNRKNNKTSSYRRVINENLAYELQGELGLAPPAVRHVCLNIDDDPTVTMELQAPDEGYLEQHDLSKLDYLSRAGYKGITYVDGDPAQDNFLVMLYNHLLPATGAAKTIEIRTNLWYESIRYSMALVSLAGNGDQHLAWNMFQHRRADNGLWTQYTWDTDISFLANTTNEIPSGYLPHLHPYYQTPDYPSIWGTNWYSPLGTVLFYPYDDYTEPYRYRQQVSLWRFCHTMFTTNYLYPKLDLMVDKLTPVYDQLGVSTYKFNYTISNVKTFIQDRRDFLLYTNWFDKNTTLWATDNIYDPSGVVISEIMYNPNIGGEYIELYNTGTQAVDLTWWLLESGTESYHLPHGTILGPTSYLAVADSYIGVTNGYRELRDQSEFTNRYTALPLWDVPLADFLSETEYSTRIIEIPNLTLPGQGAVVTLRDLRSNIIDQVTYSSVTPWPNGSGVSLELADLNADNADPINWRSSFRVGTPAMPNTAIYDTDNDALLDSWENQVVAFFPAITSITQVLPDGDIDGDGMTHEQEFILGSDPTINDKDNTALSITNITGSMKVSFPTILLSGTEYDYYKQRFYTLQLTDILIDSLSWSNKTGFIELPATGGDVVYTNDAAGSLQNFRYKAWLQPDRP